MEYVKKLFENEDQTQIINSIRTLRLSKEDFVETKVNNDAFKKGDIKFLNHIIFDGNTYLSFSEKELLSW